MPNPGEPNNNSSTRFFATMAAGIEAGRYRRSPLPVDERIHHYEIVESVGRGGMSDIYKARHIYLENVVALKTISTAATPEEAGYRFLREAVALAKMSHPNVLQVIDAGYWKETPYIVTEFLHGSTVSDLLATGKPLTTNQTLDLLEQLGHVLVKQEKLQILHRDIKPSNILRRASGDFCLFDYGLVGYASSGDGSGLGEPAGQLTGSGVVMGTPTYMAPEQFTDFEGLDDGADIYSLGLTAYECITGENPRRSPNSFGEIARVAQAPVAPPRTINPRIPAELDTILSGMTALNRDDRYESARIFLREIEDYRYQGNRPRGPTKGSAFMATPYAAEFERSYEAIMESCLTVYLSLCRVDKIVYVDNIWDQIVREIENARVLIADFSGEEAQGTPNPNVLTEAAHARAIGKPIIIITRDSADKLPFDWRHVPMVRYRPSRSGLRELSRDVEAKLRFVLSGGEQASEGTA